MIAHPEIAPSGGSTQGCRAGMKQYVVSPSRNDSPSRNALRHTARHANRRRSSSAMRHGRSAFPKRQPQTLAEHATCSAKVSNSAAGSQRRSRVGHTPSARPVSLVHSLVRSNTRRHAPPSRFQAWNRIESRLHNLRRVNHNAFLAMAANAPSTKPFQTGTHTPSFPVLSHADADS